MDRVSEQQENFDSKASQLLSQEANKQGDAVMKSTDKVTPVVELVAGTADTAKAFGASSINMRDTLNAQAAGSQEAVLGQFQETMITAEDVAFLEQKFGRPLETLRVMSTFSEVAENPIKAMSELNRMILDAQKS
ncbi:MAG: hypothetical protein K2Y22_02920 [Candidatus Obscuribacterales bacterium]|nr:hypothetical protein [Candidatus Obscuribacterales bacterium]